MNEAIKHLPNLLTIGRIVLTPVFLVLILMGQFWEQLIALLVFIIASISDWLDGKLARRYQISTRLGKFLDPLADKILVLSAFIVLPFVLKDSWIVPWWGVAVIVIRDVLITGLRMYSEAQGRSVITLALAKTKTAIQLTFLILVMILLAATKVPWEPLIGQYAGLILYSPFTFIFMLVVVALTAYTGYQYLRFRPQTPARVSK
jgi:CDP-diacylglycerol--glycerol-3-phosphate 3-phosphatidyltransferase